MGGGRNSKRFFQNRWRTSEPKNIGFGGKRGGEIIRNNKKLEMETLGEGYGRSLGKRREKGSKLGTKKNLPKRGKFLGEKYRASVVVGN